jgi:hypothetical protein
MSRRKSDSRAAIDIGVRTAERLGARGQFDWDLGPISSVRRAPRPHSWPPALPADRVPVPPPKGGVVTRGSGSALLTPAPPRRVGAPVVASAATVSAPPPSSTIVRPAPVAPLRASANPPPLRAVTAASVHASRPLAGPSVPEAIVWPRRPQARWMLLVGLFSAAAGAVLRDRLPSYAVDRAHAALAHPSAWLYARVAGLHEVPTGHPLPARPEPEASPATTAAVSSSSALALVAASAEPPEVSVSSLPVASPSTGPRATAPPRAEVFASARPRTRIAPHPVQTTAPVVERTPPPTTAPVTRTRASAPPVPAATKAPAPGSLDDLIRKAVEKDQKKH